MIPFFLHFVKDFSHLAIPPKRCYTIVTVKAKHPIDYHYVEDFTRQVKSQKDYFMNDKVLHTLEFDKVVQHLAAYAGCDEVRQRCLDLRPITDEAELARLQQQTADALTRIYRQGSISFAGTHNVHTSLKRLELGSSLNIKELLQVASLLEVCKRAAAYGREDKIDITTSRQTVHPQATYVDKNNYTTSKTATAQSAKQTVPTAVNNNTTPTGQDSLSPLFAQLDPLLALLNEIRRCILSEDEIADDASPALFKVRKSIHGMNDRIHAQLAKLMNQSDTRTHLQDPIVTMRDGRYCLPVKAEAKASVPGMIHDQSSSGSTLFIEPMAVVNLNNELRELYLKEQEEIHAVLQTLSDRAAGCAYAIELDYKALTELDFIFAKAMLAKEYNGIAPVYNKEGTLRLRRARHPLLDPKRVVPIDVELGADYHQLIVTGPNTGGKTVSLKTVGLLTLMGQSGLHIPAGDRSELPIYEEVFADIGDEQSIEQSLSTFSSHMTNIVRILDQADDRSLVLLDELCAGTDPSEGAALATSILQRLAQYGSAVMATTHYSELKVYALTSPDAQNASCEFDVETLSPTYRLLIGIPGKSNAFAISSKLGLEANIIEDARARIGKQEADFEDLIANLQQSRTTIEKEQQEIDRYKEEITRLKNQLTAKQERLDQSKDKILREANEQALQIIADAKSLADETIRNFHKYGQTQAPMREMEQQRTKLRVAMSGRELQLATEKKQAAAANTQVPKKLRPGDRVKVLSMNVEGIVQTAPDAKGNLFVQMGILRSQVNIKDLVLVQEENPAATRPRTGGNGASKIKVGKSANTPTELKLIGMTVDEALPVLDKYLDDAYLAHLPSVRIVHGKGTGALRKAVQNHLRHTPHIKSYRLGEFGEGDAGVTIVELE